MYRKSILPNGMRVVTETIPYVKSVTLGVWFGTGSRSEQERNHGISHFIEHLMFKGTQKRSARDIAETVDAVGGQLNAFTAKEYTCYYMKVIDSHLDLAVDILSDMLLASKFSEEDIERERQVVLEEVNMYEDSPDELVHDLYVDAVWPGHTLGRNILGSRESIEGFDRELVLDYCRRFYTADNCVIAAAGNVDHDTLVAMIQRYFGQMNGLRERFAPAAPVLHTVRKVQIKDTEQVHLCLGTGGVRQNAPEIYAVHIINNFLGGGISSRLFQSIREDRGLAYSVYSYQSNYSDAGLLSVYAGTRPANVEKVTELILENMADLKRSGLTPDELTKAKEQLKGSLMLGLESSSSRMSRVGKLEITLGKYITLDEVVARIDQVSLTDIDAMLQRLFVSEMFSYVALGPVQEGSLPPVIALAE
ncbi:MAG TPA: pitrilysin family protein [Patescibacteria group bacterium]|nr:pitrilysin family protein [Patescibacteria group bacterium]